MEKGNDHQDGISASGLVHRLARGGVIEAFDFSWTSLRAMVVAGLTFRGGRFDGAELDDLEMTACTLERVSFADDASLRDTLFESCVFRETSFTGADLSGSLFVECTFDCRTTFAQAQLQGVRFRSCIFAPPVLATMRADVAGDLVRAAGPPGSFGRPTTRRRCPHPRPANPRRRPNG